MTPGSEPSCRRTRRRVVSMVTIANFEESAPAGGRAVKLRQAARERGDSGARRLGAEAGKCLVQSVVGLHQRPHPDRAARSGHPCDERAIGQRRANVPRAGQDHGPSLGRRPIHRRARAARGRPTPAAGHRFALRHVNGRVTLAVVIGANGAGKTTWARRHRQRHPPTFYNADSITGGPRPCEWPREPSESPGACRSGDRR